jgi:hypothetical protein
MSQNIKAGLLLRITTCENDADNYHTEDHDGLSAAEVDFLLMIARLFGYDGELGNGDRGEDGAGEDLDVALDAVIQAHRDEGGLVPNDWDKLHDPQKTARLGVNFYQHLVQDLIGIWNDGEYWRVFEDFQVLSVPHDIEDVTSRFS